MAETVTLEMSYTVTSVDPVLADLLSVGDTGTAEIEIDPDGFFHFPYTDDGAKGPLPGQEGYFASKDDSAEGVATLGPWTFPIPLIGNPYIVVSNDTYDELDKTVYDGWSLRQLIQSRGAPTYTGPTIPAGWNSWVTLSLYVADSSASFHDSSDFFIPSSDEGFDTIGLTLTESDFDTGEFIRRLATARADSFAVPEPSVGTLAMVALMALGWCARQSRSRPGR